MEQIKSVVYGEYFIDFTKGGVVYNANDGFYEISGYTKQDVEDGVVNFFNFVPDEYREKYDALVNEAVKNDKPALIQHPFIKKNGTVIYVLCLGCIKKNSNGERGWVIITDHTEHMNLISKYNSSITELDSLTSIVPGGVVIFSVDENDLTVFKSNDEFLNMLGISGDITGKSFSEYISQESFSVLHKRICISVSENEPVNYEFKVRTEKEYKWFRLYGNIYKYSYGKPLFYSVILDVTEDIHLNNELLMQAEKFRIIADSSEELFFDYDVDTDRLKLTTNLSRYCLDYDNCVDYYWRDECPKEFVHPKDYERYKSEWQKMLEAPMRGSLEFRTKAYDDDYTWYNMSYVSFQNEHGRISKVFGKIVSIQHLKSLKKKIDKDSEYITYLLETDSLTGLLNRKAFKKKAGQAIMAMEKDYVYGVVYTDINDFSYVNDNFGYEAGNRMLRDFAKLLRDTPTNILGCRLYSDYFIGLYRARTREELLKSIEVRNMNFTNLQKENYPASDIRVSCGIFIIPDRESDITVAIDNANLARRSVKSNSSIICGIYSQRMRMQRAYEQSICSELHSAIANRNIEMFLQPKFHMVERTIIGAEALARWRNLDGSYKMPYEFIPVLEKVGYIDELDFFIYEEVLKTLEQWKKDGLTLVPISVNFSQHHILQPRFVESIVETANKYDVDKSLVEIEITESSFSGDTQALFSDMERLRSYGFKISIDDFGIGYSTLGLLMKAPVDIVKIDKSFIDNIEYSKLDRDFVANLCRLVDTAKKDVIFEGVETDKQANILSASGYSKAQGWLFDKAIPLDKFNKKYMY